jgi:hypothetical protein
MCMLQVALILVQEDETEPYLLNSRIIRKKNISMNHTESEVTEATAPLIQRLL